jgi:hypothetical protein
MSTVAQILGSRADDGPTARFLLATVTGLTGRRADVRLDPGQAQTTVTVPLDIHPVVGDRVVVMIHPTVRIVLARLEITP